MGHISCRPLDRIIFSTSAFFNRLAQKKIGSEYSLADSRPIFGLAAQHWANCLAAVLQRHL